MSGVLLANPTVAGSIPAGHAIVPGQSYVDLLARSPISDAWCEVVAVLLDMSEAGPESSAVLRVEHPPTVAEQANGVSHVRGHVSTCRRERCTQPRIEVTMVKGSDHAMTGEPVGSFPGKGAEP